MGGRRGCGGIGRLRCGGGDHLAGGPILPVTSRSGLRRNSDGHGVTPDISISDGLARLALAWWVPIASSRWSLGDSDSDRAGSRAIGRLRSWHWGRSDWGGSRIGVDGSDNWIARGSGPYTGSQVGRIVCCTVRCGNWSRARDEGGLGNVVGCGVGSVIGLRDGVRGSAGKGRRRGHVVALGGSGRLCPVTPGC